MIFKKGDILQFCLEGDKISNAFVFFLATRDTVDQDETVRGYLPDGNLALTRDAHRYNLVSGSVPTYCMEVEGEDCLTVWYKNRPYSKYITVLP